MIAYTDLKTAIIGFLEIDSTDFTKYNGDANLNAAQLFILNFLAANINDIDHSILENEIRNVRFNLTKDNAEYQWPGDYLAFYQGWINYTAARTNAAPGRKLTVYDPDKHIRPAKEMGTLLYPFIDLEVESGFGIYPIPTANQENGGQLGYLWKMPTISSTQDCMLAARFENVMTFQGVSLCSAVEDYRPSMVTEFRQKAMDELKAVLKLEKPERNKTK